MNDIISSPASNELAQVVKGIIASVSPEKIYLLGTARKKEQVNCIFLPDSLEKEVDSSFFFLVLAKESEIRALDELQDIIENRIGLPNTITALVMPVHEFNTWLMNDHPFASKVYYGSKKYYDAGITPLAIPDKMNETSFQTMMKETLLHKSKLAVEFLAAAELFLLRKQAGLAVFNLHQAAEQNYLGLIQLIFGLRVQTHNLDKLHRYASWLAPTITAFFPRNSERERELFRWLQRAYTEGRYKVDYSVKYPVIAQLIDRVKQLTRFTQTINSLKSTQAFSFGHK